MGEDLGFCRGHIVSLPGRLQVDGGQCGLMIAQVLFRVVFHVIAGIGCRL